MNTLSRANNFVLRFANVNGTGSASANSAVAKTIFRMGFRMGAKNMFPSNIQGMPTWYEIRVNQNGFTGRGGDPNFILAMNPRTLQQDTKSLTKSGYIMFDSSAYLANSDRRHDVNYIDLPASNMAREAFSKTTTKPLLQNMIYVGALIPLLNLDRSILHTYVKEQFKKKTSLLPLNLEALDLGEAYAREHFPCPLPFALDLESQHSPLKNEILMDGNTAAAIACVYAGATVCAWYPITPSTSVAENFAKYSDLFRTDPQSGEKKYVSMQAEDEISAIGMVLGASWNGARAFTATSGPGISLMSEFLGYAYYAEIPAVILNIQRCGPATGMPTRNQQADLLCCAYASHGDTRHILLLPKDPHECFEFTTLAFDLAEQYQTPIILMSDLEIGMNEYVIPELTWDDSRIPLRGKVLSDTELAELDKPFARYDDLDGDGVCYRTYPGCHKNGATFTRGSGHDRLGRYTEDPVLYTDNMDRIEKKFTTAIESLPEPEIRQKPGHRKDICFVYFGSSTEALNETLSLLSSEELEFDSLRITAFPFSPSIEKFLSQYKRRIVVEQNRDGQMHRLLRAELGMGNIERLCSYDGLPLESGKIAAQIKATIGAN